MERVILGTGLIGTGLAEGARSRGEAVAVWNRSAARAAPLAADGVRVAASVAEAVGAATVVHLALTADEAVDAVVQQVFAAAPDVLVVDHSTTSVDATAARATKLAASRHRYLHCPVFMNPVTCRSASGVMLCSGPRAWFDEVAPRLQPMTGELRWVGEAPGAAAAAKLVGNAAIVQIVAALADTHRLAASLGLDADAAHALVQTIDPGRVVRGRGARLAAQDFTPHWSLSMARKDVGLMLQGAGEAPIPVLRAVAAAMDAAIEAGDGELDLAVLGRAPA